MRRNALLTGIFILFTVISFARQPDSIIGKSDCWLEVEGVNRHFIVYHPEGYDGQSLPVVFMFHGTSGNGEKFYNISGWKEKADRTGLIAVFPSALRYCVEEDGRRKNTTKWNEGKLERTACEGQEIKDDVLFFREMVKFLRSNYPVDQKRIYASGFSNGANFVSRLTLEASDILAATTMFAGYLQDPGFQAVSLIPAWLAIGDLNVKKNTGELPEWGEEGIEMPGLHERVMTMVDKLELERTRVMQKNDTILTYIFNHNKGTGTNEFRFSLVKNLEHRYPNGKNHNLIVADLFWDFFKKYSK